jgi:hypothetical protein
VRAGRAEWIGEEAAAAPVQGDASRSAAVVEQRVRVRGQLQGEGVEDGAPRLPHPLVDGEEAAGGGGGGLADHDSPAAHAAAGAEGAGAASAAVDDDPPRGLAQAGEVCVDPAGAPVWPFRGATRAAVG